MRPLAFLLLVLAACRATPPPDTCLRLERSEIAFETTLSARDVVLVRNDTDELLRGVLKGLAPPFSAEASLDADGGSTFTVNAHDAFPLAVRFEPQDSLSHLARVVLTVTTQPTCAQPLTLTGTGVGDLVIPSALDFGTIDVGQERTRDLQLVNTSGEPVDLEAVLFLDAPDIFTVSSPLPLTVAPHSLGLVSVRALPPRPEFFTTQVFVKTSLGARVTRASVSTGVPVAQLEGAPFDVPEFGFTTGFGSVLRRVTLRNIGTPGVTQLQLVAPGLLVTQVDGGPATGVIELGPSEGPQSAAPGSAFSLDLRISPKAEGDFTWLVQLFTTAPAQPVTMLTVHTNSRRLQGCTLDDTDGGSLDVRLDGTIATWPVTNVGNTPCLLDGPRVDAVDSFALVDGGFVQRWLAPGETHVFAVQSRGPDRGELTFVGFTPEPTRIRITLNPR